MANETNGGTRRLAGEQAPASCQTDRIGRTVAGQWEIASTEPFGLALPTVANMPRGPAAAAERNEAVGTVWTAVCLPETKMVMWSSPTTAQVKLLHASDTPGTSSGPGVWGTPLSIVVS